MLRSSRNRRGAIVAIALGLSLAAIVTVAQQSFVGAVAPPSLCDFLPWLPCYRGNSAPLDSSSQRSADIPATTAPTNSATSDLPSERGEPQPPLQSGGMHEGPCKLLPWLPCFTGTD